MLLQILLGLLIIDLMVMITLILMQRSEGGALGIGGGGGGQFMTSRGAGNFLTKGTQITAAIMFILALAITVLSNRQSGVSSITEKIDVGASTAPLQAPAAPVPSNPAPGELPQGLPGDVQPLQPNPNANPLSLPLNAAPPPAE